MYIYIFFLYTSIFFNIYLKFYFINFINVLAIFNFVYCNF